MKASIGLKYNLTYKLVPDCRDDLLVGAPEPLHLSGVNAVLVQVGHCLSDVVLRHNGLVQLRKNE